MIGLWNAELIFNEKAYYFTLLMFGLFAAVSVQKAVRDRDEGVPVTEQSVLDPTGMPDRISIYRIPHCEIAVDAEDLREWVRETVLHELGHHLGLSEERLEELGWD